ncbi:hypothetical protein JCM14076_16740 [Methylosoma difficile]
MIKFFKNLPIHRKLFLALFVSSSISLFFAGIFLVFLQIAEFQKSTKEDFSALATLIGNRSTAALMFQDKEMAEENLAVLKAMPGVERACIYDLAGVLFVQQGNTDSSQWQCPEALQNQGTRYEGNYLYVVSPIMVDGEKQGAVYIFVDVKADYVREFQYTAILLFVLVTVSVLSFFVSAPLLRLVAKPINQLANTVKTISETKDYSLRAEKMFNDELGVLVDVFNGLIITVESQNSALTRAKDRYQALYNDNPSMLFNVSEKGRIYSINITAAAQLNLDVDDFQGNNILNFIHSQDLQSMHKLLANCHQQPWLTHKQEVRMVCGDDRILWVRMSGRLLDNDQNDNSILLVCEDVTEARHLGEKVAYQASHDALTGLANRSAFDSYILKAVESALHEQTEHVLCYLDLDQFKIVNDTCGHFAGDELLRQLSDLLKKLVRHNDFIARLGGDEFGILMYDCTLSQAYVGCEHIRDVIRDFRFAWEDRSFAVGVSIGITSINAHSRNAATILKEADAACYAAKDKGRNRVHVFRPDDEELALRHGEMQWVTKLQQGLEQNSFCLYGQRIVSLNKKDEGLHFETLIRYRNHLGAIVPPGAFLPAAERYNLASELDRWVIAQLFSWLANTPGFLEKLSLCTINLSGLSLCDETMFSYISSQFRRWHIPTHKICFEITETAAIANLSHATRFINQLRDQGCLFSLDDFGSGLSSFAYLKNLPVDFLKIDGLFVKDMLVDEVDMAMVKSINEIGQIMGKKTVAEFVENEAILRLLTDMGVDYAQGYCVGKPIPLDLLLSENNTFSTSMQ